VEARWKPLVLIIGEEAKAHRKEEGDQEKDPGLGFHVCLFFKLCLLLHGGKLCEYIDVADTSV